MEFTASQIAEFLQGTVDGDADARVSTFAKIEEGVPGALSFLSNPKYTQYLYDTKSSVVLVNRDFSPEKPVSATLVRVDNAYESIARLLTLYESMKPAKKGISSLASISEKASIGKDVYIAPFVTIEDGAVIGDGTQLYPHVTVGSGVRIGSGCILYPNVTVYYGCEIGNRCTLHAGSVIGADGFGFAPSAEGYNKIPQIGIVTIEDDVELGANTCIDRAVMGHTVIGRGTKMDNMVQIGHNVVMGQNNVCCAQVGIAGTTKIGNWNTFAGQVGVAGQLTIGNQNIFGAQSGIPGNIKDGQVLMGTPVIPAKEWARQAVYFKRLPEMQNDIKELKKEINKSK